MKNKLLKFITCGSVDDGKSTLIGHMLYDAKLIFADQKRALELDSKVGSRDGKIDYSLLLDGLMAEREQGLQLMWHTAISAQRIGALLWLTRQGMKNIPGTWRWGRLLLPWQ